MEPSKGNAKGKSPKQGFKALRDLAAEELRGHELRAFLGRKQQSVWAPARNRADPVALLLAASKDHLKELLPIKFGRMARSSLGFLRGAVSVMAADLAHTPTTGLHVQLCGDAHVQNLDAYAAPDGSLVFDLNDFDQTCLGPWEWDVKRMAVSLLLAGQEAGDSKADCRVAVREFVRSYRESMKRFSEMKILKLWKYGVNKTTSKAPVKDVLEKADHHTCMVALKKLTVSTGRGLRRFRNDPPFQRRVSRSTARKVFSSQISYRETLGSAYKLVLDCYRPVDVAFKVVGIGSIGTRDYVVLLLGNGLKDPLLLQMKQELPSCYAPFLPRVPHFSHQGRRVAEGQDRMQTVTDPFVGWTTIGANHYVVRQLADHKATINPKDLKGRAMIQYATVCGEVLAKAHARTGNAGAIAGYCGSSPKIDKAITRFAISYAEQSEKDRALLLQAIKSGRVKLLREL